MSKQIRNPTSLNQHYQHIYSQDIQDYMNARKGNQIGIDKYNQIKYDNTQQMLTPPDDREFNYHLGNIDSISQKIAGLLSFVDKEENHNNNTKNASDKNDRKVLREKQARLPEIAFINKYIKDETEEKQRSDTTIVFSETNKRRNEKPFKLNKPCSKYIKNNTQIQSIKQERITNSRRSNSGSQQKYKKQRSVHSPNFSNSSSTIRFESPVHALREANINYNYLKKQNSRAQIKITSKNQNYNSPLSSKRSSLTKYKYNLQNNENLNDCCQSETKYIKKQLPDSDSHEGFSRKYLNKNQPDYIPDVLKKNNIPIPSLSVHRLQQLRQSTIDPVATEKFIYTVREELSSNFQSKNSEKNQNIYLGKNIIQNKINKSNHNSNKSIHLKNSRKSFKYLEQQDINIVALSQSKRLSSSIHKCYVNSQREKFEDQKQQQKAQYFTKINHPKQIEQKINLSQQLKQVSNFQIKLYPCDLDHKNIRQYIADRLLILLLIDLQIQEQRKQIQAFAYSQLRIFVHKNKSQGKNTFEIALTENKIEILNLLKKQFKEKGFVDMKLESVIKKIFTENQGDSIKSLSNCKKAQPQQLVKCFVHNVILGEKYWNNKLKQILTFNQLDNSRFDPEGIDLETKGYLKVEDITCFINLNSHEIQKLQTHSQFKDFIPLPYQPSQNKEDEDCGKKLFKNKETMTMFRRFINRMKIYYGQKTYGSIKPEQIISNLGISYQCFMDKLL